MRNVCSLAIALAVLATPEALLVAVQTGVVMVVHLHEALDKRFAQQVLSDPPTGDVFTDRPSGMTVT